MAPSDYDGRALALPIQSPTSGRAERPSWSRRDSPQSPYSSSSRANFQTRIARSARKLHRHARKAYDNLSLWQKLLGAIAGLTALVLGVLFLVYSDQIFCWLAPAAQKWRDVKGGWLILWAMTFVVSFPPLIGYSTCVTIAGFVYGFPNGWFIVASATLVGSTASFLVSRSILKSMVHRLISNDKRFAALALTLKHDGLKLLIMIRLCPLPYSLSNGAISTIPTVHWASFAFATAIVSPKLLLHVFVGSQMARIAKEGSKMDMKTRIISYVSIIIGVLAGALTGWFIYRQTKARAAELEAEESDNVRRESIDDLRRDYADDPDALEAAVVLREDDDDISLRDAFTTDVEGYHDESPARELDEDDVFAFGDGETDEEEEDAEAGKR